MQTNDRDIELCERRACVLCVAITIQQGIGREMNRFVSVQKLSDGGQGMFEIPPSIHARVTQQKEIVFHGLDSINPRFAAHMDSENVMAPITGENGNPR
jgi:hypothetical protein